MQKVAVIGLGLIGGSIATALRQQQIHVTAFDQDAASLEQGLEQGAIDKIAPGIADAIHEAELVVLAVPVLSIEAILIEIRDAKFQGILTDVGSVKGPILSAFRTVFGDVPNNFIAGHPIAGSEKHGVGAANPQLFNHHRVLLTPLENSDQQAVQVVTQLWESLGAEVSHMSPEHHDSVLAQTSHLPHLLAYQLVDTLSQQGDSLEIFDYAAGGLRDFSRIAASDPNMWRDIFMSNQTALLDILDRFSADLGELRAVIEQGDGNELIKRLGRSKSARDHFSQILEMRKKHEDKS